jgi:hypothetical protein
MNIKNVKPITVASWSKAWTIFARTEAVIVGSNPTQGMDVSIVCVYSVCVVLRVDRGLATDWSPVQGILSSMYRIKKLKKKSGQGPTKGCRAIIIIIIIMINVILSAYNEIILKLWNILYISQLSLLIMCLFNVGMKYVEQFGDQWVYTNFSVKFLVGSDLLGERRKRSSRDKTKMDLLKLDMKVLTDWIGQ